MGSSVITQSSYTILDCFPRLGTYCKLCVYLHNLTLTPSTCVVIAWDTYHYCSWCVMGYWVFRRQWLLSISYVTAALYFQLQLRHFKVSYNLLYKSRLVCAGSW